jgi:hypothetical protein
MTSAASENAVCTGSGSAPAIASPEALIAMAVATTAALEVIEFTKAPERIHLWALLGSAGFSTELREVRDP